MARINHQPAHPERICWGCEKYCPADSLGCGNGTIRCPHPVELFGDAWLESVADPPDAVPPEDTSVPKNSSGSR